MNLMKYLKEFLGKSKDLENIQMGLNSLDSSESIVSSECIKSNYFFSLSCIFYVYSIILSLYLNKFSFYFPTYCLIAGWIIEISWKIVSISNQDHFNHKMKYFRFISLYISLNIFIIFPSSDQMLEYNLQIFYYCFFILNYLYFYYFDFIPILHVIIPILNSIIIICFRYRNNFTIYFFVSDIGGNLIVYFMSFFMIKKEHFSKMQDQYLNHQCIQYIQNFINKMDNMVISMKGNEILFVNDYTRSYFENKFNFKIIDEAIDDNNLISDISIDINKIWTINSYTKYFFKSLFFNIPSQNNSIFLEEGKSFYEIILVFLADNKITSDSFIPLGYFNSKNGLKSYEIKMRKLNSTEQILEILINDVTDYKKTEKLKIDRKYKQMLLAKIAHELKTPLITMTSLIQNTIQQNNMNSQVKNCLNYLNHLSDYSLVIIRDIILYASNLEELKLSLNVINLREILDFSYNILITLIQCNENKINKIKPSKQYDDNIDKLTIISDENILKQIIINFISNSYKFTKSGFIKLHAKRDHNSVLISVEDSGLGINDKDHHLIFKEATQLNIDQEYNTNGSGVGLSISKKLSDSLNHKMIFKSKYGEGSRFSIQIDCKTNYSLPNMNQYFLPKNETSLTKKENSRSDLEIMKSLKRSQTLFNNSNINVLPEIDSLNEEIKMKNILNSSYKIRKNSPIYSEISDEEDSITVRQKIEVGNDDYLILRNLNVSNCLKITNFEISLGNFLPKKKMFCILVVDDNKFVRETSIRLIKQVLSESQVNDIEIIELCDGIELLNTVIKDKSNLIKFIFIDEDMEFMNGSEAVRIIRKLEKNSRIHSYQIVSVTAFDDIETKNYIAKSGVDSILIKPCSKSNIRNVLKILL